jgi:hypothetical protein
MTLVLVEEHQGRDHQLGKDWPARNDQIPEGSPCARLGPHLRPDAEVAAMALCPPGGHVEGRL